MDPQQQQAIEAAAAAAAIVPAAAVAPAYEIDYDIATAAIGTLPSLHPRPSHTNIHALERALFDRLETLQSTQSEEWGFRGLAEQPAEYALKSATPWVHSPNPGLHRQLGLNAGDTRDAEALYNAEKAAYQAQTTVTRAIIAALNIAVPKAFKRSTAADGGAIVGAGTSYRHNHDPRTILLALRTTYGIPSPAERNANDAAFAAPWNPAEPIETYFDRLEDCYVAAIIASPPYTMEQMMTRAIMAVQLTGLYSQALIEWNGMPAAARTWDALKMHFTTAYVVREQSGTGTTGINGYHSAANVIANDDALNNIESTLNHELSNLQVANNAHHQSAIAGMAELRAAITAAQQQIALLTVQVPTPTPAMPPNNYQRNNNYRGGRNNYRGRGGGRGNNNAAPAPPAVQPPAGIPPAPTYGRNISNRGANPPNPNKYYNNQNYCFSCGYDIPLWHTSATCNDQRRHHQVGCTRQNVAQYEAAGHACSKRGIHKTIMPTNPTPEQA
jgi:hypothetical protein